ncbi:uncharacterized protein V6R79_012235 [Siganus canaliculatus]
MALFFSGAVTSSPKKVPPGSPLKRLPGSPIKGLPGSPIKRRLRSSHGCHSLDTSLLSPDSSYVCYSSVDGGDPCSCRRSPRLLTNGYYSVTEDSFSWDQDGNVSLTPCKTSVSYKENLVRVFRRRRRPRGTLARLLSDVTESCQSWLDENVFRGVFGTGQKPQQDQDLDQEHDQEQDWTKTRPEQAEPPAPLSESFWSGVGAELHDRRSFTYDHTEIPPPPDKMAPPPKVLIQEEICSEICQSKERFTQSLGGLSEVPPPSPFYSSSCCCQASPGATGLTMKTLLLLIVAIFILTALHSGCVWRSVAVATTAFAVVASFMFLTKSGPLGEWRRAKTEDITSRNE